MQRRREAAGLVASILILAVGPTAGAQAPRPTPDPSSQGPVGLTPIRSLGTLNGIPSIPGTTPASASTASIPVDPTTAGPAARVPDAPIGPTPVGMPTLPSLRDSINTRDPRRVLPPIGVSSWFRKAKGRAGSPAPVGRMTPAAASTAPSTRARVDPATVPSAYPEPLPLAEPAAPEPAQPPPSTGPAGRPSPYANQVPSAGRPQADRPRVDPTDPAEAGRPAPLASDAPSSPRPRALAGDRPPGPRPTAAATAVPKPRPKVADPAPVEPGPTTSPPMLVPPPAPPIEAPGPVAAETPRVDPVAEIVPAGLPPDLPVASSPAPPAPAPMVDPEVKTAGVESDTAVRIKPPSPKDLTVATRRAAAVGDEIITFRELLEVVNDRFRQVPGVEQYSRAQIEQIKAQIAEEALNQLIDQRMVLQEVKRATSKNAKAVDQFNEFADKKWKEDELPPLLRSTATANEYELKKKLAEAGKSYDEMKEGFRRTLLANDYLMSKIRPKVSADLIEQKAYYYDHLKDYQQPARMNWREIEINFGSTALAPKYPDRAAALRQAEATLARLAKGEGFDAVAKAVSDGPTASKGGLYVDMSPGGYGIPSVNEELNRLPVGKLSGIIEAPNAFHIVRIESRREAGPLRFDEVHEKIRDEVFRHNYMKAKADYLAKLRSRTLIRTMFDNPEPDPARNPAVDPAVRAASR